LGTQLNNQNPPLAVDVEIFVAKLTPDSPTAPTQFSVTWVYAITSFSTYDNVGSLVLDSKGYVYLQGQSVNDMGGSTVVFPGLSRTFAVGSVKPVYIVKFDPRGIVCFSLAPSLNLFTCGSIFHRFLVVGKCNSRQW
jgi:hypothetical protein